MFDVTIAGEINLDLVLYGLPRNMPTERELLASDFQATLGSSSAILAHNLAVLGANVGFITRVGTDELGKIALERLTASGTDMSRTTFDTKHSTGITVLLHHGKERHILTYPGTMREMTVRDLDIAYLKSSRHFHLSSLYLQTGLAPDLPGLFRELKRAGLTISLDTNDDPEDTWGGVLDELLGLIDLLLPNEAEARRIAKRNTLEESLAVLSQRVPCIAVKRGAQGALVQVGNTRLTAPAVRVTPIDTVGAGDSFNAGFLFAWLRRLPLDACARAGNITGALSTLRPGGTEAFRDRELMITFLKQHNFPAAVAETKA
ncbi:MAG TPA: carbohydrate kinase family protein [Pseudacidobacterium sp.]|nr:carbohydrate kinase family protein [Pseudacidobacterium sp.]